MSRATDFQNRLQDRIIGDPANPNRPAFQRTIERMQEEPVADFKAVLSEEESKLASFSVRRMVTVSAVYFLALLLTVSGATAAIISSVVTAWPVAIIFGSIAVAGFIVERLLHPKITLYQQLLLYKQES